MTNTLGMKENGGKISYNMKEGEIRLRPGIEFDNSPDNFVEKKSEMIIYALKVAQEVHNGEMRKVGVEPYISHCVAVASILDSWGADDEEIVAGLLHDSIENHPDKISLEDIKKMFGERVMHLVDGVTKLKSRVGDDGEFETLRKVTKESFIEPGVALIKLADRLHNMLTMEGMLPEIQIRKAKETLYVYAPLAESFGLWQVKNLLQDMSFQYVDPNKFIQVKNQIDRDPRLKENFIEKKEREVNDQLTAHGIRARVEHQVGGYFEMSEKLRKFSMRAGARPNTFADITDVISFRVIVDDTNLADCYKAMGIIRLLYSRNLMRQRHNDYLVVPATNGYSAAHDTYRFEEGDIEVAFSTEGREAFNNWGVVSLGKDELRKNAEIYKRKLIFTPKKELVFMELTATGVDVAYKLNPLLGRIAIGMKVDGRVCGLEEVVPNSSVVEILRDQDQMWPNINWLNHCNPSTKGFIEQQLLVTERDNEVSRGKKILSDEVLFERGILNITDLDGKTLNKFLMDLGCWNGISDLYYKVAYGFDLDIICKKLDEVGIVRGMYTSVEIKGKNQIGVSKDIAEIVSKCGGDVRNKVEKVDSNEKFIIRMLLTVGYEGKKKIEQELKKKYKDCVVV